MTSERQTQPPHDWHLSWPGQLRQVPVRRLARTTIARARHNDLPGAAAEVAYHALFAIPAVIVVLTALAALINRFTSVPVVEALRDVIYQSAPSEVRVTLLTFVENGVNQVDSGIASFSVLSALPIALWAGSNGVRALMKAFNRAYTVEETRSFARQRGIALGLTLLLSTIVTGAFVLWIFGGQLGQWVAGQAGQGPAFTLAWDLLRWPLAVILVMFLLTVLYYLGPNVEQSFWWLSPGSVIAAGLWFLVLFGFKLYLYLFSPGGAYGSFSSVIFLLALLFLTAAVFILGVEINAVCARRFDPTTIRDLARNPDKVDRLEHVFEARWWAEALERREGTRLSEDLPEPPNYPRPSGYDDDDPDSGSG